MKLARFAFAAALGALALSCGGDEGTGPGGITIADLAGTWDATTATFEGVVGSGFVDLIADGGSVTLTITGDGRFTFVLTLPGESPETASGTMHFEEDFLVMTFDDDPSDPVFFIFFFSDDTLTLAGEDEFDFDDDGVDEPAIITLVLQRR
jgi:hypothetical protein